MSVCELVIATVFTKYCATSVYVTERQVHNGLISYRHKHKLQSVTTYISIFLRMVDVVDS